MSANRDWQGWNENLKKAGKTNLKKNKKTSNHRLSDNSRHTQHFAEPYKQAFKFWPWILVTYFSHIITHLTLGILCIILNHTLKSECNPFPTISTWPVIYLCVCVCMYYACAYMIVYTYVFVFLSILLQSQSRSKNTWISFRCKIIFA